MNKLKRQMIFMLTAIMLSAGWGGWWILQTYFADSYFSWYPSMPVFFYALGLLLMHVLTRDKRESQVKLVNLYMILKLCKVTACILYGGSYLLFVREQLREFSFVFIVYFLIYLALETYFFYRTEEVIKHKKTNE